MSEIGDRSLTPEDRLKRALRRRQDADANARQAKEVADQKHRALVGFQQEQVLAEATRVDAFLQQIAEGLPGDYGIIKESWPSNRRYSPPAPGYSEVKIAVTFASLPFLIRPQPRVVAKVVLYDSIAVSNWDPDKHGKFTSGAHPPTIHWKAVLRVVASGPGHGWQRDAPNLAADVNHTLEAIADVIVAFQLAGGEKFPFGIAVGLIVMLFSPSGLLVAGTLAHWPLPAVITAMTITFFTGLWIRLQSGQPPLLQR